MERSGSFDGPPRGYGAGAPAGSGERRARNGDSPSGVFSPAALPPAPPPARPMLDQQVPAEPRGRRRARDDDSSSGTFGESSWRAAPPPARPAPDQQLPAEPRGRRRAGDEGPGDRRPSESYDHGPELVPIIKPLANFTPQAASTEPPPLVPIFQTRPDPSPTSGSPGAPTGRRARRAAEEEAATRTGDVAGGRRRDRTGEDTGTRRQRPGFAEDVTGPRTGDLGGGRRRAGSADDSGGLRNGYDAARGDDTGARRQRSAFPDAAPDEVGGRRNGFDEAGGRRNGFGPARPDDGIEEVGGRRNGFGPARPDETTAFRPGEGRKRSGFAEEEAGGRRRRPGFPDGPDGSGGRPGDPAAFRRGDDTGARRTRAGFEAGAPATETGGPRRRDESGVRRRDEALRRQPAVDEAPQQRRALDDAMPGSASRPSRYDDGNGYDDPSVVRRRGDARRGTGEYPGDYTTGGTRRALREPPGGRPTGPPGRSDRSEAPSRSGGPGRGGTGMHPKAVIDPVRPEHRPHRWVAMLSVIAIVLVLGACGIGTWFIFKDERNGPESAKSSATAGPKKRDISSRQVDPEPLTEAEVFPSNNIVAVPNEPPYVILSTKASPDCKVAATEQLATLLVSAGCTEVVRATMKSPTEDYLITAGIFNLLSEKSAKEAFDGVKGIVDGQKGRFAGMSVGAGTGTDALVRAPTQLGWNYKGHFIAYCVIARVDGNPFTPDDPYPNQITYDIVETYLENGIIESRAIIQPDATPAASLPVSAPPS